MDPFQIARTPVLLFGNGRLRDGAKLLSEHRMHRVALCMGGSFSRSARAASLERALREAGIRFRTFAVSGEPSPELVDGIVNELMHDPVDAVVSVGGGSVIDTGKAVSAMIVEGGSVAELLEEVGSTSPSGKKVPFIAVPTTAGTGSEATKNAVISRVGKDGFKKSLRHDNFVPDIAIIDPELATSCPPDVTAASGMDAVTQLLEGFVATNANAITDSHARTGLMLAGRALGRAVKNGAEDLDARGGMALAAYLSGVVLANAGLGVVHGIASPAGGLYRIPHGVVCANLVAEASRTIIEMLESAQEPAGGDQAQDSLEKYAEAGRLLSGRDAGSLPGNCRLLVETLETWTDELGIPRLGRFGIDSDGERRIAALSSGKNSPVKLTTETFAHIIEARR